LAIARIASPAIISPSELTRSFIRVAKDNELTDKLIAERRQIIETEKGYEFQYRPASVSLAELAEWAAAEGKCCPFFDFHIDLEREGKLLCL
jgi:hypothetical protein